MADAKICLEHALIYRVALFPIDVGRLVTFFILGERKKNASHPARLSGKLRSTSDPENSPASFLVGGGGYIDKMLLHAYWTARNSFPRLAVRMRE